MSLLWPHQGYAPRFPAGPGVLHGSAVACRDGRVLYVYSERGGGTFGNGGRIRGVYFASVADFVHDYKPVDGGPSTRYLQPEAIPGSDHVIIDGRIGACSVWWMGGQLMLTANYRVWQDEERTVDMQFNRLFTSPSGNGGDWVLHSELQPPMVRTGPAWYMGSDGLAAAFTRQAGVGTLTSAGWVVPSTVWLDSLGYGARTGLFLVGGGKVLDLGFGFLGGTYVSAAGRQIAGAPGAGWWWEASGNVSPTARVATSPTGGSWTVAPSSPGGRLMPDRQPLAYDAGIWYRASNDVSGVSSRLGIESAPDPVNGPWSSVVPVLRGGNIHTSDPGRLVGTWMQNGMLRQDLAPGQPVLYSHDKVWHMFGGWLLGAIGRS